MNDRVSAENDECCCTSQGGGVYGTECPLHAGAAEVEAFNRRHPIGTPVRYWPGALVGAGAESTTRSNAWVLGNHTPVVLVEGYPGGIALTHVEVVTSPASEGGDDRG